MEENRTVFAIFAHLDDTLAAIRQLRKSPDVEFTVFSPVPHHQITHLLEQKKSPVRMFTLAGGLLGLAVGWGITLGPIGNFNLHVGGKPLMSIPPFGVVAYICTILFGALATVAGMIVTSRLPNRRFDETYDPRLSSDHFGIQVRCSFGRSSAVLSILQGAGAVEIKGATTTSAR